MTYIINRKVPIPRRGVKGKWVLKAQEMKVGDSVVLATETETVGLSFQIRKLGFKPVVRKIKKRFRVWKLRKLKK